MRDAAQLSAELELEAATEALNASRERFRATFEQAAVGMAHVGIDGRWLEVNERLCQIVGYRRAELLERSFQDITHPGDLDADLEYVRRVLSGEIATYSMEKRYLRKDGSLVWIDLTVSLVRDADARPSYFIAVVQDISARKAAEEALGLSTQELKREIAERRRVEQALRESEALSAAILQAALDCVVTVNQSGIITEFNPAAERTFGYTREQAVGKALADLLVPPSLRARHIEGFQRYLRSGQGSIIGRRVEITARRSDGSEFPVELAIVPTVHRGEPIFAAYIRDISERQQAQRALQESEARFRHLAEAGIIGIVVADTRGEVIEANGEFLRMVGREREEVTAGRLRWNEITPKEWRFADERAKKQLESRGVASPWEKEYFHKDGSRVPVLVGAAALTLPRCIAFVLDLSERRKAERARVRATELAERESQDRERAEAMLRDTEEQLRQSQKMEAIGSLAGSIAHDFNNLLSVILSYAEILTGELEPGEPMRTDLEQIGHAARRANALTRQLLAFSRRQVLQPKFVNLNHTLSTMSGMLRRVIGEDVELSVLPAPNLGTVYVDPGQMEQVLLNLIVNARDSMPRGGKLTLETAEEHIEDQYGRANLGVAPGQYVVLSVTDTGEGMDRATQARIFEPFFTTKEPGKGTGLGLSTVFGIVKQSGGSICVYSEPGRGSTFKIFLPRSTVNADPSERAGPGPLVLSGSETVLLVEDDEQVRRLVEAVLRRHGYDVLAAATGGEALSMCERYAGDIHVLITDVVMPHMSGRQLWERLAPSRPGLKVLFMSGYADDAIVHHGVVSSDSAFVGKPLLPPVLLSKLRSVLDGA